MRSFRNIGLSVYGLLPGIIAMYSCKSADSSSPLKKHYYVMQGYRPVALWENNVVAENPFPLSEYEKETLLDSAVQVCQAYMTKYPDHNLDTWSKDDCEAYLRAKAIQIILQFQPDYYRAYAIPEIRRRMTQFGVPYYRLDYYYDFSKEDTESPYSNSKEGLITVDVNVWNAQASGFSLPIRNGMGISFRAPDYENSLLKDWVPYPYMIRNRDYDWKNNMILF